MPVRLPHMGCKSRLKTKTGHKAVVTTLVALKLDQGSSSIRGQEWVPKWLQPGFDREPSEWLEYGQ